MGAGLLGKHLGLRVADLLGGRMTSRAWRPTRQTKATRASRSAVDPNRALTARDALRLSRECADVPFILEHPCNTIEEIRDPPPGPARDLPRRGLPACTHIGAKVHPALSEGVWIAAPYIETPYDRHNGPTVSGAHRTAARSRAGVVPDEAMFGSPVASFD